MRCYIRIGKGYLPGRKLNHGLIVPDTSHEGDEMFNYEIRDELVAIG